MEDETNNSGTSSIEIISSNELAKMSLQIQDTVGDMVVRSVKLECKAQNIDACANGINFLVQHSENLRSREKKEEPEKH